MRWQSTARFWELALYRVCVWTFVVIATVCVGMAIDPALPLPVVEGGWLA